MKIQSCNRQSFKGTFQMKSFTPWEADTIKGIFSTNNPTGLVAEEIEKGVLLIKASFKNSEDETVFGQLTHQAAKFYYAAIHNLNNESLKRVNLANTLQNH